MQLVPNHLACTLRHIYHIDAMNKSVAVIGSWFGGLSAALHLAKEWYQVDVFEKNDHIWWRASILQDQWFTRDMWPSRYLMPDLFEKFFAELGEDVHQHLTLTKLWPSYKIYFKDTPHVVDIYDDIERNRETFERLEPGSTDRLKEYVKKAGYQYEIAMDRFVEKNYTKLSEFFTREMLTQWAKINIFTTIGKYVAKRFKSDQMQKIIQYPMVFLGSPPYKTPAIYNLMTYVDFGMGVRYPQGGIYQIIKSLRSIGEKNGVRFHTNAEVTKINVDSWWKTTGITLIDWTTHDADIVVSNADMQRTETKLLQKKQQTYSQNYRDKKQLAPSGFLIYLGIKGKVAWLDHHTLVFGQDRDTNNEQIFYNPTPPTDPSFYICCPSKTDPSVAPEWDENLFILVPFPAWVFMSDNEIQAYRDKLITTTEELIGDTFSDRIVSEKIFTAKDFQSRYNAFQGTALGLAHTFRQTAIFRPTNKSKKVKGLYYTGGYTNPGIGMPMCLISGKLATQRILEDYPLS